MKNRWSRAFISSSLSIVPMMLIVLVLSFTDLAPLGSSDNYLLLVIGMLVLIVGLAIFQIGAGSSLTKVGEYMGSSLSKQKNIFIVILFAFALGTLITVAEPSILIVSKQVNINPLLLIGGIAVGVGLFVVIGVIRIITHKSLKLWYLLFYFITFMVIILVAMDPDKKVFLPFIFDSGGVTTGSATVPFILSLGAGIAVVRGGKNSRNDSFGLVGMASIGPILTVTLMLLLGNVSGDFDPTTTYTTLGSESISHAFLRTLLPGFDGVSSTMVDVLIAIAPTMVIFLIYNFLFIHLPKAKIKKLLFGFLFSYVGLTIFLTGTGAAMTPIGFYVGTMLGLHERWIIIVVAFVIGLVTILCEPAVHVLTTQMEDISDGRTKKITVLFTLSLGVGVAIGLAVIRTIFNFSIMYYMVPGYLISICLMFICPDIFTAMAFDSGGTASGPMAASFVLPMIVGITVSISSLEGTNPNYYEQSFGVVAMIALTPVIAIQILGVINNYKSFRARIQMRAHVYSEDDAQIIHFK